MNMAVALDLETQADARRIFDALAEKGTIQEKIFDVPWGGIFGALRDEFGIAWMLTAP